MTEPGSDAEFRAAFADWFRELHDATSPLTGLADNLLSSAAFRSVSAAIWAAGYQTCCGDFDIAARADARSANPYTDRQS